MARPRKDEAELALLAAELQAQREQDEQDLGYLGRLFTQFSLPYKDPGMDRKVWGRETPFLRVSVQPGMYVQDGVEKSWGFPFGGIPRVNLAIFSRLAFQQQSRVIEFWLSQSEFMKQIGLGRGTGGKTGSIQRFQEQTERLLRCQITVEYKGEAANHSVARKLSIADSWDLWWTNVPGGTRRPKDKQPSLIPSKIELSEKFYLEVMKYPVPVDMGVLNALQSSPMAMDIYIFTTYTCFKLTKPLSFSYPRLMLQFGTSLADTRQGRSQFRRDFKKRVELVKAFHPQLRFEEDESEKGFVLYPSETHVLRKPARRQQVLE